MTDLAALPQDALFHVRHSLFGARHQRERPKKFWNLELEYLKVLTPDKPDSGIFQHRLPKQS